MIRSTVGLRRAGTLAAMCGLLLGCDEAVVDATGDARLVLDVRMAPAAAAAVVDQFRIHIDGPSDRTITAAPGTSRTIDGLAPGTYTVSLEGLSAGEVETFGETGNIRVVAGENTTASVAVNSFVPGVPSGPAQAVEREAFTVSFAGVPGAVSYRLEWWPGDDLGSAQSQQVTGTNASITVPESGPYTVRVRALNRFGSVGRGSSTRSIDVADGPAVLIHRWSFGETGGAGTVLVDDVGGADGVIVDVGPANGVVQNGRVTLAGGTSDVADYVSLPSGLVSGLGDLSVEIWATPLGVKYWSRIFDFGASESDFFMMSWSIGADPGRNQLEWRTSSAGGDGRRPEDVVPPFRLGVGSHIVVTIDDDGGPYTEMRVYLDGEFQGTYVGPPSLADIADQRNWLGRSQYVDDETAHATYDEVRIWDGALTDDEVMASFRDGPVADLTPPGGVPTFALYPTGVDHMGALLGPAELDPHYTLVEWPGASIPDVIAIPFDETTPGEDDPNDYPRGSWADNSTTARWIGPDNGDVDQDAFGPTGESVYRTHFTIPPGIDLSSIRIQGVWYADNDGVEIRLNGNLVDQSGASDILLTPAPFVLTDYFIEGSNRVEFRVYNGGGPTGFRVEDIEVTYDFGGPPNLVVTPSRVRMGYPGAGVDLTADVFAGEALAVGLGPASFSSSNTSVVTVDASGKLLTTGRGSAVVTVQIDGYFADVAVDVAPTFTNPIVYGGHTYAQTAPWPWQTTQSLARAYGAHMVSIADAGENQALVHPQFTPDRKWLGFTDIAEEGVYVWSDESEILFTAWQPGEPNSTTEDCAIHEGAAATWNDVPCFFDYPAIVEWDWTGDLPLGGVQYFGSHRYAHTSTPLTWIQARNLAESLGARLVSIDSPEEQAFLATVYPTAGVSYWIGLDDRAEEGRFVGPTGGLPLYTNWNPGEPNDSDTEDCAALWGDFDGRWNDFRCHSRLTAIFEWDESPVPVSGLPAATPGRRP